MNVLTNLDLNFDDHNAKGVHVPGYGPAQLVPVFVYGSLRPRGRGANGAMEAASVGGPWPAVMAGRLYFHRCGAYPVMDTNAPGSVVRGDVYLCDVTSRPWQWVEDMEVGAGYDPQWRPAFIGQDNTMRRSEVIVFGWNWPERGDEVTSGDWLAVRDDWQPWPTRER